MANFSVAPTIAPTMPPTIEMPTQYNMLVITIYGIAWGVFLVCVITVRLRNMYCPKRDLGQENDVEDNRDESEYSIICDTPIDTRTQPLPDPLHGDV